MQSNISLKNGEKVYLRPPQLNDLNQVLEFINKLADEDAMIASANKYTLEEEEKYLKDLLQKIKSRQMVCLYVFDEKDNFLGSASVEKKKGRSNHIGLFGIALAKKARGQGIGKLLMRQIIALAKKELNLDQVVLTCFAKNDVAQNLYKALGFQQYGYLPNAYLYKGEYVDQINFYKKI